MTDVKATRERRPLIRNIAEVPWDGLPGHHGGALSKLLVHPETAGPGTSITESRRISRRPT